MKYVDEYRDRDAALAISERIARRTTRPWRLMEVCGGQTHAIARFGLEELLPPEIQLLHGPGCPVCVTPIEVLDQAIAIAARPEVIFCSYGDMLRVPGSERDLRAVKAAGGDVRVVYSAMDALALAREQPTRQVVFFAVGFETTAPGHALSVHQARKEGLTNFSLLVSHVLVPPALRAILASEGASRRVDAFLAAGHVCAIMGTGQYEPIAREERVPIVVTGFEPLDILAGVEAAIAQLEGGRHEVENLYQRAVRADGNVAAQAMLREVFTVVDRRWRGIADIPESGLALAQAFAPFDASLRFDVPVLTPRADHPAASCKSGLVLLGALRPPDCPQFGSGCTPDHPLGATMVSGEGACAAYYKYRRSA